MCIRDRSYEKLDLDSSDDEDEEDKRIDESAPEPKKEEKPISQPPPQSEEEEELNVQAAKEIQEEEDYCNIINEMQQIVEGEVLPENDENVAPEPRRQEGGSSTKDLDLPFNKRLEGYMNEHLAIGNEQLNELRAHVSKFWDRLPIFSDEENLNLEKVIQLMGLAEGDKFSVETLQNVLPLVFISVLTAEN
eukprot:TRINITY_DN4329_c0_g1_i6.p1 TRINITY_DN4329_c0_g1~~TRINITY_DN4329_c0_g1_i6.p1  ORF type:complete len:191 (-),score=71.02 TRINITY_DN4329_c0_g1_i6:118-690(-)